MLEDACKALLSDGLFLFFTVSTSVSSSLVLVAYSKTFIQLFCVESLCVQFVKSFRAGVDSG